MVFKANTSEPKIAVFVKQAINMLLMVVWFFFAVSTNSAAEHGLEAVLLQRDALANSFRTEKTIAKRQSSASPSEYDPGTQLLSGWEIDLEIPHLAFRQVRLILHNEAFWYAAAVEQDATPEDTKEKFVIRRFEVTGHWKKIVTVPIVLNSNVAVHSIDGFSCAILQELETPQELSIFIFGIDERLHKVQKLDFANLHSTSFWERDDSLYMAISKINGAEVFIYKWENGLFNLQQSIATWGNSKILSLQLKNETVLLLLRNIGHVETYSELLKYDGRTKRFHTTQKIRTRGAIDTTNFCFNNGQEQEYFLLILNTIGKDGSADNGPILYKYNGENYVPFQNFKVENPMQALPFTGLNGEFLLILVTKSSVKLYQNDGWRFIETPVQFIDTTHNGEHLSLELQMMFGQPKILLNNGQTRETKLIQPKFVHRNMVNVLQESLKELCMKLNAAIDSAELKDLRRKIQNSPKKDSKEIHLYGDTVMENATISNLVAQDHSPQDSKLQYDDLSRILRKNMNEITSIKSRIQPLLEDPAVVTLDRDVRIRNLKLDDTGAEIELYNVNVHRINAVEDVSSFLRNVVRLEDGVAVENLEMNTVHADYRISTPITVNNRSFNNVAWLKNTENVITSDIVVVGDVKMPSLSVGGLLDGVQVSQDKIFLKNSDQKLSGTLSVQELHVSTLKAKNLKKSTRSAISVKSLTVTGKINGVELAEIHRKALLRRGDQTISGKYRIERLKSEKCSLNGLVSGRSIPRDMVSTKDGSFTILQDLKFKSRLQAHQITVNRRLNQIMVDDAGNLGVLQTNTSQVQYVDGEKTFGRVKVMRPLKLQGNLKTRGLDAMKPVKMIKEDVVLEGDYTILANASIERSLVAKDLVEKTERVSVGRLKRQGLALDETNVNVPLTILPQLYAKRIQANRINGKDPDNWLAEGKESSVTGKKIFSGNVDIENIHSIKELNGIHLDRINASLMKTQGDQMVEGTHHFTHLEVKSIEGKMVYFNHLPWSTVTLAGTTEKLNGLTMIQGPLHVKGQLRAESINILGHLNGHNFTHFVADTAFSGGSFHFDGAKRFADGVSLGNLNYEKMNERNFDYWLLLDQNAKSDEVIINGPVKIEKPVKIGRLVVEDRLNGLPGPSFGKEWMLSEGEVIFSQKMHFEALRAEQMCPKRVNGHSLDELLNSMVNVNDDIYFDYVELVGPSESERLIVNGVINEMDFQNELIAKKTEFAHLFGHKTFLGNVYVADTFTINDSLQGLKVSTLCAFSEGNFKALTKLTVNGTLTISKPATIDQINDYDLSAIAGRAWYPNQDVTITGNFVFENVTFEKNLPLHGPLNGVIVKTLNESYFSKSKNMVVSGNVTAKRVEFAKNIVTSRIEVGGTMAGLDFSKFAENILMQGADQEIENSVHLETVVLKSDAAVQCLINGLNLSTDVARYDMDNVITAPKKIQNIRAYNVHLAKSVSLQEVDVQKWIRQAVLRTDSQAIKDTKIFRTAPTFRQGIRVENLFNGFHFSKEQVLLKSGIQAVTGSKTFSGSKLAFQTLKVHAETNDINLTDFLTKNVDRTQNAVFWSDKTFLKSPFTTNANFESLLNDQNVTQIVQDVVRLNHTQYFENEYETLNGTTDKMIKSYGKGKPYLLEYFILIMSREADFLAAVPIMSAGQAKGFATFTKSGGVKIRHYIWNRSKEIFTDTINRDIAVSSPSLVQPVIFNTTFLFLQEPNSDGNQCSSFLFGLSTPENISVPHSKCAEYVAPIFLHEDNEHCLYIPENNGRSSSIYCTANFKESMRLKQQITSIKGHKAYSYGIGETTYLAIMDTDERNGSVSIWAYDEKLGGFRHKQIIYVVRPLSIDFTQHKNTYYLAITSGQMLNSVHPGFVIIERYNDADGLFSQWQHIRLKAPLRADFAKLPSGELILYVLSSSPAESLIAFRYEGIFQFVRKITASTMSSRAHSIHSFNTDQKEHFIIATSDGELRVLRAKFTGEKHN